MVVCIYANPLAVRQISRDIIDVVFENMHQFQTAALVNLLLFLKNFASLTENTVKELAINIKT